MSRSNRAGPLATWCCRCLEPSAGAVGEQSIKASVCTGCALAERLRQSLQARPTLWQSQWLPITASLGWRPMGIGDAQTDAVLVRAAPTL